MRRREAGTLRPSRLSVAVIAAGIALATACAAAAAPQAARGDRIDAGHGLSPVVAGARQPGAGTRAAGRAVPSVASGTRARPWMVHDHDDSDRPTVAFVPAPERGRLILVRHADRDPGETVLNATGTARARALPAALRDLALDAIFIAEFRRNAETAAPLAEARGLVPEIRDPDRALAAALARAADGGSAIWIGNVGNLSHLWDAYRLPGAPPVDYGEIAVLTAEGGKWQVSRRTVAP